MGLLWPGFLLLSSLIPLILVWYVWMLRRRRRFAVRYSSLSLVRAALPRQSLWKRHFPFALFLIALLSLVVALGRPFATIQVPAGQAAIILAMDVSRSMCSTDIKPNRLEVAKEAALSYINRQEPGTQIGVIAFAGFAAIVQPPTSDQEMLQDAIEGLTTGRRTAIGSAILESLSAIAEINPSVAPMEDPTGNNPSPTPVPEGYYTPDVIVLLTDGASNSGPYPLNAAQEATIRGVRIYTIGFGTENGGMMDCALQFGGLDPFGGGPPGGGNPFNGGFRRGIDEPTLIQIAEMTGGDYYSASSANELQKVFRDLPTYFVTRDEHMEISVLFTAFGALMAALAIGLSLLWHPLS